MTSCARRTLAGLALAAGAIAASVLAAPAPARATAADPAKLADAYADAVEKLNAEHAREPQGDEDALAARLPAKAADALDELLAVEAHSELADALARAGEAALDLARVDDFERVRARLAEVAPERAGELGVALARPRYLLRGMGGLSAEYLAHFAEVLDAVLGAYDEVFGFDEYSKVPGKKLRVRVHLESEIRRPPHFAPQFPYHSEIDFPVIDAERLRSPTADGKFLFYGLCHELGHVIAMWGDRSTEEDHHAWAHYTGIAVVEHLSRGDAPECLADAKDARWRSIEKEREELGKTEPSRASHDGVMALFLRLHDELGPRRIGDAIARMDAEGGGTRVNRVRYYRLDALRDALVELAERGPERKRVQAIFDGD